MRKGQITLFLILAVAALVVFAFISYKSRPAPVITPVDSSRAGAIALVGECTQSALSESLVTVGLMGDADSADIEYLDDDGAAVMMREGEIRLPSLEDYSNQIASYAVVPFQKCLNGAETDYSITWESDIPFRVMLGDTVTMMPTQQFKLVIGAKTSYITGGAGIVDLNLPLAYSALQEYLEEARDDLTIIPITSLISSHLHYDLIRYPGEIYLINITDPSSSVAGNPWNWRAALVYLEVTP